MLVLLFVAAGALMAGLGGNDSAGSAPRSLPDTAESVRIDAALRQFPDAGSAPAIVVTTRADGGVLSDADRAAAAAAVTRAATGAATSQTPAARTPEDKAAQISAQDGRAVIAQIPIPAELNGFPLVERIEQLRRDARDGLPAELTLEVTGGPAFAADIADSFSGANATLLAVTAIVVAALLILTYRSPVLWLLPLLIIGLADRVAIGVGGGLAGATGLTFDGSTSGITSVLVFGAGTNYALLLVSRYRDELHRESDHRLALRQAVRRAGPAIVASNLTVVAALLVLALATVPSTRSLGVLAAAGLLAAVVFVLAGLPPALALCGRKVFWPFVPRPDGTVLAEQGIWHTIATRVTARPVPVLLSATAALAVCAAGLLTVDVGLSQTEQFRLRAESVTGFDTLATYFPGGTADQTVVVARADAAEAVQARLSAQPGVVRAAQTGTTRTDNAPNDSAPPGTTPIELARWAVVLDAAPGSDRSAELIGDLRASLAAVPDAEALVGGGDARALDASSAAARDQRVVVPLILVVVCLILLVVLRAVPAALLLITVTVLSALAALGLGSWIGVHLAGFPALDTSVPLFAFLFLVALGVDYTIFLTTRALEETPAHGTTEGMVRAVSATGAVITSAGLVLAAVFAVLGVLPLITLTQLGIVVGIGIVLDTFVVRTLIIPALFRLVGPRIWWPSTPDAAAEPATAPR